MQCPVGHRETSAFTPRQVGAMEGSEERDVTRLRCSQAPLWLLWWRTDLPSRISWSNIILSALQAEEVSRAKGVAMSSS